MQDVHCDELLMFCVVHERLPTGSKWVASVDFSPFVSSGFSDSFFRSNDGFKRRQ